MGKLSICLAVMIITGLSLGVTAPAQEQGAKLWYAKATISRVKKPNRKPKTPGPLPKVQKNTSLLTLQYHLFERLEDNQKESVDPNTNFATGDQVKLAITANQDGYLYIISQPEGKDGVLLFPDPAVNEGKNFVKKDTQYSVPYRCSDKPNPDDCWIEMTPPAGTETMVVIFSRDQITTLPTRPGDPVSRAVIAELQATASKKVTREFEADVKKLQVPGQPAIRYATRVRNTDLKDNEELITIIQIKHGE